MVFTVNLDKPLNLNEIKNKYFQSWYNPRRFSGLIMRVRGGTVTLFSNGKAIILGCTSNDRGKVISRQIGRMFGSEPVDFRIVNIVMSDKFRRLDLVKVYILMKSRGYEVSYEPERLAAAVLKMQGLTFVLFHTGSVNITGGTDEVLIRMAMLDLKEIFEQNNIFFN